MKCTKLLMLSIVLLVLIIPIGMAVEIESILLEKAKSNPNEIVSIVVDLENNNEGLVDQIREATKNVDAEITAIGEDVKIKFRNVKKDIGYYDNEEESLELLKSEDSEFMSKLENAKVKYGFTNGDLKDAGEAVDKLRDKRAQIVGRILKDKYQGVQDAFVNSLNDNVKVVYQDYATNKVVLEIKAKDIYDISKIKGVNEIIYGGWPDTDELDISVPTIGADTWHSNGVTGGTSEILFINSNGILTSHPNLDHINWFSACLFSCPNGPENPSNDHDTIVAGILGSDHSTIKGVAPSIDKIYNAVTNDYATAVLAVSSFITGVPQGSAAEYVLMSKSWGGGTPPYCGDEVEEEYVDDVVDLFDVNWIKSAGNDGGDSGYNGVSLPAGAYNIMAVGASDDKNTIDRFNDEIWENSSLGPVEICGSGETRIKPDIVAPGKSIISTTASGGFATWTGTSFSAPHVASSLVLLDDGFPGMVSQTRQSRALLFNTAEDRDEFTDVPGNDGPDNTWGYGYLDMDRAYLEADNTYDLTITGVGSNIFFEVPSVDQNDKATMVWNRHIVSNDGVTNNLDLFLYDESTGNLITSSNYVGRNIEQVTSDSNYASGVIKVNLKDLNTGSAEDFGIAYNGVFNNVGEPSFDPSLQVEESMACNVVESISVDIFNDGDLAIHNVVATLNLPIGLTLVNGANPQNVGTIESGNSGIAMWNIEATGEENVNFDVDIVSQSYGDTYVDSVQGSTYIGSEEVCFDSIDNDCDGHIDEGCIPFPPGGFVQSARYQACKVGSTVC